MRPFDRADSQCARTRIRIPGRFSRAGEGAQIYSQNVVWCGEYDQCFSPQMAFGSSLTKCAERDATRQHASAGGWASLCVFCMCVRSVAGLEKWNEWNVKIWAKLYFKRHLPCAAFLFLSLLRSFSNFLASRWAPCFSTRAWIVHYIALSFIQHLCHRNVYSLRCRNGQRPLRRP